MENPKVNYLSYDYEAINSALINYAKSYFPESYNDFSKSSPVGFFIGIVSYMGDLLSFYIDKRFQESILQLATDRKNIINLARFLGYNHKSTGASTVDLSVYQLIPKKENENIPDYNYAMKIDKGMAVSSLSTGISFTTLEDVDFSITGSNMEISSYDSTYLNTSYYVLKKNVKAISGEKDFEKFTFEANSKVSKITLSDKNIISIESCIDSDGNVWYEVPYLAQDMVAEVIENSSKTNSLYNMYNAETPYLLNFKKTTKRFIRRTTENDSTELFFGFGNSNTRNEDIIPTQEAISQLFLDSSISDRNIDSRNFLEIDSLGEYPSDTTLTITYIRGGGTFSNVNVNDIKNIISRKVTFNGTGLWNEKQIFVENSLNANNLISSIGGRGSESDEEIKNNSIAYFSAQNRVITKEDYEIRVLSLDPKFGSISKVNAIKDSADTSTDTRDSNTISLYCISTGINGKLMELNEATKFNLMQYLNQYRILTDNIIIRDAYIINIGVSFQIKASRLYNSDEVLFTCLQKVKEYFNIEKWKIGQHINLTEIYSILHNVVGVYSVDDVKIVNKGGENYADTYYNIDEATRNNIVYSSLDPAIFEVKFPSLDIEGIIN